MGIDGFRTVYEAVMPEGENAASLTAIGHVRRMTAPIRTRVLVDVSCLTHTLWRGYAVSRGQTTLATVIPDDAYIGKLVTRMIKQIDEMTMSLSTVTLYLDGKAPSQKIRTRTYSYDPTVPLDSFDALATVYKDSASSRIPEEFTDAYVASCVAIVSWASAAEHVLRFAKGRCTRYQVELWCRVFPERWGHDAEKALCNALVKGMPPMHNAMLSLLATKCPETWTIIQCPGEADHLLALDSLESPDSAIIVSKDTDLSCISLSPVKWVGKSKKIRNYDSDDFWAYYYACFHQEYDAGMHAAEYRVLRRYIIAYSGARPSRHLCIVLAIASALLYGKTDYSHGCAGKGPVRSTMAILTGAVPDLETIQATLPAALLDMWYPCFVKMAEHLGTNITTRHPDMLALRTEIQEYLATLPTVMYERTLIARAVTECQFRTESVQVVCDELYATCIVL